MVFGLRTQPKSWLTGYTFWVNHYLEIVFSKISVVNPPPPLSCITLLGEGAGGEGRWRERELKGWVAEVVGSWRGPEG